MSGMSGRQAQSDDDGGGTVGRTGTQQVGDWYGSWQVKWGSKLPAAKADVAFEELSRVDVCLDVPNTFRASCLYYIVGWIFWMLLISGYQNAKLNASYSCLGAMASEVWPGEYKTEYYDGKGTGFNAGQSGFPYDMEQMHKPPAGAYTLAMPCSKPDCPLGAGCPADQVTLRCVLRLCTVTAKSGAGSVADGDFVAPASAHVQCPDVCSLSHRWGAAERKMVYIALAVFVLMMYMKRTWGCSLFRIETQKDKAERHASSNAAARAPGNASYAQQQTINLQSARAQSSRRGAPPVAVAVAAPGAQRGQSGQWAADNQDTARAFAQVVTTM